MKIRIKESAIHDCLDESWLNTVQEVKRECEDRYYFEDVIGFTAFELSVRKEHAEIEED